MHWRLKAAFFWGFHLVPRGADLHYLAQRRITRSLPRHLEPLADYAASYLEHVDVLGRRWPKWPSGHLLEFGAGRDLFGNLLLWCCGVERQTVIDITPLLKPELINHVLRTLRDHPLPPFVRRPERMVSERGYLDELRQHYGIDYRAPADARRVDLADGSIDLVVTTNTLEHIPAPDIAAILAECHRLCSDDAALSMVIDYSDHYSHADPSLTAYNFLGYDDRVWRRYNPPDHYQNRLRHRDHRALIEDAGFWVVHDQPTVPDGAAADLARVRLAARFAAYPREALLPTRGHLVGVKKT